MRAPRPCSAPALRPPRPVPSLYVHVPFCAGKCAYCGIFSRPYTPSRAAAWMTALSREIEETLARIGTLRCRTIYVGGGTPTVLPAAQLDRLCQRLGEAAGQRTVREWTVEAHPGSLTPEHLDVLRRRGVNRLSLGAQSLNDRELSAAGRPYNARQLQETVRAVRRAGFDNLGLDLMAGLPESSFQAWLLTLRKAVDLGPDHVSVYPLSVEPGSRLARDVNTGRFRPLTADEELRRTDAAWRFLTRAGYVQYEISNFALPGRRCRHNIAVWKGEDYLGLGPSAASRVGLWRWTNDRDLNAYARRWPDRGGPRRAVERLGAERDAAERFMFATRLSSGVDPDVFCRRFPAAQRLRRRWEQALRELHAEGRLRKTGTRWRLTALGRRYADAVAGRFASG